MPGPQVQVPNALLPTMLRGAMRAGVCCIGLAATIPAALGQTNAESDLLQTENVVNLSPLSGWLRLFLWILGGALLVIALVLIALRYRVSTNLYKATSDEHWKDDSEQDAGERLDAQVVLEACDAIEQPAPEEPEPEPRHQARLFTPAHGPAWSESMLKAFLGTCMKVNCLGRTWKEAAERQLQSNVPDPREAELTRRLIQRWQEFQVDQETGVFLERSNGTEKDRVCVISVCKDKRTLVEAAFNAGFVIENVGRYLKNTDLVYPRGLGEYHAPTRDELAKMTPGEKESLVRITEIPDPWRAMIGATGERRITRGPYVPIL